MPSLRDHYLRTTYRVTDVSPPIDIRIGKPCPALDALLEKHSARAWAFVTAWNPGSKKFDDAENHRRQQQLEAEVKQGGYVFYRGAGIPDDFVERSSGSSFIPHPSSLDSSVPDEKDWLPEESILILGIERAEALRLANKYEQAAIVFGSSGGTAELVFI